MSTVYDFDKDESLFSPIEFKVEGKTYRVTKITKKILDQVSKSNEVHEQFAIFVNVKPQEVKDLDMRILNQAIRIVFESFKLPFKAESEGLREAIARTAEQKAKEATEGKKASSPGLKSS